MPQSSLRVSRSGGNLRTSDAMQDDRGIRILREFLNELTRGMCVGAVRFWEKYDGYDHPLRWNERSIYSLLASSVGKQTPVHLSELAMIRSLDRDSTGEPRKRILRGRADMWCYLKRSDPINILIELKRRIISLRSPTLGKATEKSWSALQKQLATLQRETQHWGEPAFHIGLMVFLPYYLVVGEEFDLRSDTPEPVINKLELLRNFLSQKATWWAEWALPEKMQIFERDQLAKAPGRGRRRASHEYTPSIFFGAVVTTLFPTKR